MHRLFHLPTHLTGLRKVLYWTLLALPVAVAAGSATALFLWSLDQVTRLFWQHPGLLWGLPFAGAFVVWLYQSFGKGAEKGNNLLIDEIHEPDGGVPLRMAPLVLLGTLVTHLFGGSAGREGTAVQMGGGLAGGLARWFRAGEEGRRLMLMCGIAAGFGAVFGTPLTGAVFAMEVLVIGRIQYDALIPVLIASVLGDAVCSAWGIHHTVYHLDVAPNAGSHAAFDALLLGKVALAAACFGLAAHLFADLTHGVQRTLGKWLPNPLLRPLLGGVIVILLTFALGTRDYLGLGVDAPPGGMVSIVSSFQADGATSLSWLWKTLFTAVTLGSGFKGGEVTPLFFVGSTLGNAMGHLMNAPIGLFAALGFIAVFAGASNTPLACTIMGIELFGAHYTLYFATACFLAWHFSGHSGIYLSQRLAPDGRTLRDVRDIS